MFDIGGWEFLVIVVVAIVVIGPKDLPAAIRAVSAWMGKARELAREFRSGLDELQREVELDKIEKDVKSSVGAEEFERVGHSIRSEVEGAGHEVERSADLAAAGKDPWEESYTYFENRSDALADDVEAQAQRELARAEAEERAAAAAAAEEVAPASAEASPAAPAPAAPTPGSGNRSGS